MICHFSTWYAVPLEKQKQKKKTNLTLLCIIYLIRLYSKEKPIKLTKGIGENQSLYVVGISDEVTRSV